jgi:hypothetical protein
MKNVPVHAEIALGAGIGFNTNETTHNGVLLGRVHVAYREREIYIYIIRASCLGPQALSQNRMRIGEDNLNIN